jgi:hypothetical protein
MCLVVAPAYRVEIAVHHKTTYATGKRFDASLWAIRYYGCLNDISGRKEHKNHSGYG